VGRLTRKKRREGSTRGKRLHQTEGRTGDGAQPWEKRTTDHKMEHKKKVLTTIRSQQAKGTDRRGGESIYTKGKGDGLCGGLGVTEENKEGVWGFGVELLVGRV